MSVNIIKPKIKRVKIKDCGIIKNADIKFKDGLNVIKGVNASGKTTVINAISSALGGDKPKYKGKVEIEFFSNKTKHGFTDKKEKKIDDNLLTGERIALEYASLDLDGTEAVLIDDALALLDNKNKVLEFFRKSKSQLIITHNNLDVPLKANIIDTKDFELIKCTK